MTTSELINELKKLPPDVKVVVSGYEDGYNEVVVLKTKTVILNREAAWWDGEFMDSKEVEGVPAVELFGENRIAEK